MSKQRHDIGEQKRRHRARLALIEQPNMDALASTLVDRGLASSGILHSYRSTGRSGSR